MTWFANENQTLYFNNWEYNAALILTRLAEIVKNNGGAVKPLTAGYIVNRSILEHIEEHEADIKRMKETKKEHKENAKIVKACNNAIKAYRAELEELKAIDNKPVRVTHTSYIEFVIDNTRYYYQIDENPFFEFYYTKTAINNNKYSRDTYLEEDTKEWFIDNFWRCNRSKEEIENAARQIYDFLINAKFSKKYREGKKTRVPNYYNNGYHYETIYKPERFETITWLNNEVEK